MLSMAWTRFSRSSKLVIRPSISLAPLTHSSACWLNKSKNLPSVGISRPNIWFSVHRFVVAAGGRRAGGAERLVALVQRQAAAVVAELGVLTDPGQAHGADRPVTLLADDDLGRAFIGRVGIIDFIAVQENNDVGILLDSAGLAQVGHHRPLVGALLQ